MTSEAQQLAIAKACPRLFEVGRSTFGHKQLYHAGTHKCSAVDPLSDLSAMHDVESVLTEKQQDDYIEHLWVAIGAGFYAEHISKKSQEWMLIHSTAAQRAEAFLRAVGKWRATP